MPKPIFGVCGKRDALVIKVFLISPRERISSSMKKDEYKLSKTARQFIAGQLQHVGRYERYFMLQR